ncbi:hypothetical protein [Thiolapillus sp.]|uniref:hypothetical protein n=1 Tax=Thiolapillus sp. TaxID=2017437 RepID=UPI0025EC05A5|nr:hypothetical protein [Thiolapillus sp.]
MIQIRRRDLPRTSQLVEDAMHIFFFDIPVLESTQELGVQQGLSPDLPFRQQPEDPPIFLGEP